MCVPTIFGADKDCLSRCRAGGLLIGLSLRGMTRVRVVVSFQQKGCDGGRSFVPDDSGTRLVRVSADGRP